MQGNCLTFKKKTIVDKMLFIVFRYCFVENMVNNGVLHPAMYDIMQEWYKYIRDNIHIQADLIGMCEVFNLSSYK